MDKREMLEGLLERGMVMITLDARRSGVDVPSQHADDPSLRLNLSYRFGLPMEISPWGIHATLTFGGLPHPCKLPWSAIYVIASHVTSAQFVFPSDLPPEILEMAEKGHQLIEEEGAEGGEEALVPERISGRPRLTLVPGEGSEPEGGGDDPTDGPEPPGPGDGGGKGEGTRASHLRRIK